MSNISGRFPQSTSYLVLLAISLAQSPSVPRQPTCSAKIRISVPTATQVSQASSCVTSFSVACCMIQLLVRRCTSLLVLASMWRPEIHVTRKWFKEVGPTSWRVSSDWFKGSKSRGNEVFVALNMGVSCKCSHKPIQ